MCKLRRASSARSEPNMARHRSDQKHTSKACTPNRSAVCQLAIRNSPSRQRSATGTIGFRSTRDKTEHSNNSNLEARRDVDELNGALTQRRCRVAGRRREEDDAMAQQRLKRLEHERLVGAHDSPLVVSRHNLSVRSAHACFVLNKTANNKNNTTRLAQTCKTRQSKRRRARATSAVRWRCRRARAAWRARAARAPRAAAESDRAS